MRGIYLSKYNSKKVKHDGIVFDSKMEMDFYCWLKELKNAGKISGFILQPEYELQPAFKKRGVTFRAIKYRADFDVYLNDNTLVTVDIKGFETADFKLKRKMFEHRYPQELKLITYSKIDGGWIETEPLKVARKIRKLEEELKKESLRANPNGKIMDGHPVKILKEKEKFKKFTSIKDFFK